MTCLGEGVPFVAHYATYWPRRWHRKLIEGPLAIGVAGEQVTLFKGDDTKGQKLSGPRHEVASHQARVAWAGLLCSLIQDKYTLSNIPAVDIEDKPTIGIKAVYDSGSEVMLYFDKSTFLLTMLEAKVTAQEIGGKLVKCENFYSDHKSFGGVKLPSKYKTLYDGKLFVEGETTAIKVHATIDPAWFGTDGPARVKYAALLDSSPSYPSRHSGFFSASSRAAPAATYSIPSDGLICLTPERRWGHGNQSTHAEDI